jgi:DNA integrity scanning protein DisA with diadenylate cyclase activity
MKQRLGDQFESFARMAAQSATAFHASALLILLDGAVDWRLLQEVAGERKVIVAADDDETLKGAAERGIATVALHMADQPVYDKLGQAMLKCVAEEILPPGARVVALYSGFEPGEIDSMSAIDLTDHLGRLTTRDLQQLGTSVPLDTLQTVVNLAVEIGREGREGKPVGTLFVVGDTRKAMAKSHPTGFDPVRGYSRKERNLKSSRVREGIKEIAQMDGAIVVAPDGTVEAAARYIDAQASEITLSKGLGARHWAAAAISRETKAVAVAVSESSGTVRIFQNGEVVLRIEPFRRPMKWRDFEYEPPAAGEQQRDSR